MAKLFLFFLFIISVRTARPQLSQDGLYNEIKKYFITLPTDSNFQNWINDIENDSTIIMDTSIASVAKDSFYIYLRFDSKKEPVAIPGARRRMVITARNNLELHPKDKIYLLLQMEYFLDSTSGSKTEVKTLYKKINDRIKKYFVRNIEHKKDGKKKQYGTNSFYIEGSFSPNTIVRWGVNKNHCYGFILSLNFELMGAGLK